MKDVYDAGILMPSAITGHDSDEEERTGLVRCVLTFQEFLRAIQTLSQ